MSESADAQTGLRADWLNGWLAALGVLRLVPGVRLSWVNRSSPVAVFASAHQGHIAEMIAAALPTTTELADAAIARNLEGIGELPRSVSIASYRSRAQRVRVLGWDRTLEATLTDLAGDPEEVAHAPFDPPMPQGITLWQRVVKCRDALPDRASPDLPGRVHASLSGAGVRVKNNGLGFDVTRKASGVNAGADVMVDPVVECLAFEGLQFFTHRGNGRFARQRGFSSAPSSMHAFRWCAWAQPLDEWAFDAFFDMVGPALLGLPRTTHAVRRLGALAVYGSVYQIPRGSADTYRAYGAERLW